MTQLKLTTVPFFIKSFSQMSFGSFFTNLAEGRFFSWILLWHVANQLYSLTASIPINCCPFPAVLGHHPFPVLVWNLYRTENTGQQGQFYWENDLHHSKVALQTLMFGEGNFKKVKWKILRNVRNHTCQEISFHGILLIGPSQKEYSYLNTRICQN